MKCPRSLPNLNGQKLNINPLKNAAKRLLTNLSVNRYAPYAEKVNIRSVTRLNAEIVSRTGERIRTKMSRAVV